MKTAESDFEMDSLISSRLFIQSGVTSRAPIEVWEQPLSEAAGVVRVITEGTVMTRIAIKSLGQSNLFRGQIALRTTHLGMRTVSITWMTPLDAMTSALMTLALSTCTPVDETSTFTVWP